MNFEDTIRRLQLLAEAKLALSPTDQYEAGKARAYETVRQLLKPIKS